MHMRDITRTNLVKTVITHIYIAQHFFARGYGILEPCE